MGLLAFIGLIFLGFLIDCLIEGRFFQKNNKKFVDDRDSFQKEIDSDID